MLRGKVLQTMAVLAATATLNAALAAPARAVTVTPSLPPAVDPATGEKTTLPAPVIGGDEEIVNVQYENGKPVRFYLRSKEPQKVGHLRRFVVPTERRWDFERVREQAGAYWGREAARMDTRGRFTVPTTGDGSFTSMVQGAVGNWDLFTRGLRDVNDIMDKAVESGHMENLSDVGKRYEFWKQAGIYDRYTPGEIAYLNSVVLPAAKIIKTFGAGGGAATAGLGAALLLAAALPVISTVGGAAAIAASVGIGAYAVWKRLEQRKAGEDFSFNDDWTGLSGTQKSLLGVGVGIGTLFLSAGGGLALGAGTVAANRHVDRLAALINAENIPVPAGEATTLTTEDWVPTTTPIVTPGGVETTAQEVWHAKVYLSR